MYSFESGSLLPISYGYWELKGNKILAKFTVKVRTDVECTNGCAESAANLDFKGNDREADEKIFYKKCIKKCAIDGLKTYGKVEVEAEFIILIFQEGKELVLRLERVKEKNLDVNGKGYFEDQGYIQDRIFHSACSEK
ncbi:hypothetical protein LPTSP1_37490 [Leptospira johnsonii]|uniref:Uncharacterized protein n=2 Tax=Leptospira johnsonii TaxID=1917820 RepID=A0A2P2D819_9LEPT|nr:hypothetical protein LPTSP1_37490 [Leptospira johnsonii]